MVVLLARSVDDANDHRAARRPPIRARVQADGVLVAQLRYGSLRPHLSQNVGSFSKPQENGKYVASYGKMCGMKLSDAVDLGQVSVWCEQCQRRVDPARVNNEASTVTIDCHGQNQEFIIYVSQMIPAGPVKG